MDGTRRVVIVVYPGVQSLDVTGPLEVFHIAGRLRGVPLYDVTLVGPTVGAVPTSSHVQLGPVRSATRLTGAIDTLLVAGGQGVADAIGDGSLVRAVTRLAARSRRVASVCSGAFLLAEAGLLEGRRAATHWASGKLLHQLYPGVTVERDPIYVRDGDVWTSAGITAGMDLALALVEDDHGRALARDVARWLVMFLHRPGGQSQFSATLAAQSAEREPLRELLAWIADHPGADLSVRALAARAAMSPRTFARVFAREVGTTPGDHVEHIRVEAACRRLESTAAGIAEIARATGFGTVETMQRSFRRVLGVTPSDYRRHFTKETA